MINIQSLLGIAFLSTIVLVSCQNKADENQTEISPTEHIVAHQDVSNLVAYNVGDKVPNSQVCMVNNAYMGKDQFEVPYDGKTYYGCCNMYVERIPNDESARSAIDPFTNKKVDKANAYIVLKDQMGNVDYFENEENYRKFNQIK